MDMTDVTLVSMPSPQQFKAARALLRWPQKRLADAIGVVPLTIKRLERVPHTTSEATQRRAQEVLEAAGIAFTRNGGVAMRDPC